MAEEIRLAQEFGKPFLSIRLDWSEVAEESRGILSRYQMLDRDVVNFHEQLSLGMQLLSKSSSAPNNTVERTRQSAPLTVGVRW